MFTNVQIDINELPKLEDVNLITINKSYFYILLFNYGLIYLTLIGILFTIKKIFQNSSLSFTLSLFIVLLIIAIPIHFVILKLAFKNRRYALRERDIIFSKGYIQLSTIILPFNRVQHVEISRSFLARKLNLSTLKIYTAGDSGSDLTISGLSQNDAHSINTYITTLLNESV